MSSSFSWELLEVIACRNFLRLEMFYSVPDIIFTVSGTVTVMMVAFQSIVGQGQLLHHIVEAVPPVNGDHFLPPPASVDAANVGLLKVFKPVYSLIRKFFFKILMNTIQCVLPGVYYIMWGDEGKCCDESIEPLELVRLVEEHKSFLLSELVTESFPPVEETVEDDDLRRDLQETGCHSGFHVSHQIFWTVFPSHLVSDHL